MKRPLLLALLPFLLGAHPLRAAAPPRLVVQIVVSQMRPDLLARFAAGMGENGFRRFEREGLVYDECYCSYMLTQTAPSLATLTTGCDPAIHGVVGERWMDYTTNRAVHLAVDSTVRGLDCDDDRGRYSPARLPVGTLGDALRLARPEARVVTLAADPLSAVVMGGRSSEVYWIDDVRCAWATSTAYRPVLPDWVAAYNEEGFNDQFLNYTWRLLLPRERYLNRRYSAIDPLLSGPEKERSRLARLFTRERIYRDYDRILTTPGGNAVVLQFARRLLIEEGLGAEGRTDLMNLCLDTPRWITERYGPESMEVEDMLYRLDRELGDFLDFLFVQIPREQVVVVLTSDHGTSDSYDASVPPRERFNPRQFCVILNGFLNAVYGQGEWVTDYVDRQVYLNRALVYERGLDLEEVQNRTAAFALQFRGISHVATSTALQNSYFGGSYAQWMQNGFYPRRSGDLVVNLMPGWIEERDDARALSGSMYVYDRHVPLIWLGWVLPAGHVRRDVSLTDVAPTLARIVRSSRPEAATGRPLEEIVRVVETRSKP